MDYNMDNEVDYASRFDNIVHKYLGERGGMETFYFAYGNNFATRSLLYTICMREIHLNNRPLTQEQINELQELSEKLSNDSCTIDEIKEILDYL